MATSVNTAGQTGIKSETNVIPMIDIMLVLLIIFMIVTPLIANGFKATMPSGLHLDKRPEGDNEVVIRLHNWTTRVAFFERAEILSTSDGDEILPIQYDDNYVTVFPGETVEIRGVVPPNGPAANWVRVAGYNTSPVTAPKRCTTLPMAGSKARPI